MSTLHERLRAALADDGNVKGCGECGQSHEAEAALRAVVELHAPEFFGGVIACLACSPGMPPQILIEAPCSTITVIAEALGIGETPK